MSFTLFSANALCRNALSTVNISLAAKRQKRCKRET
jgi:hypothetical protein